MNATTQRWIPIEKFLDPRQSLITLPSIDPISSTCGGRLPAPDANSSIVAGITIPHCVRLKG
ncbi:hypothetical protein EYF80_011269 [Liparis tanakae]|uniref:Uncharacterized protein n=1 Tax=Liparis tanakae TaxID=230148 RepID=A0A4Z2IKQ6_9TELE|nr:hypothetical protein EYF80_011269 [Liparis tanakae]